MELTNNRPRSLIKYHYDPLNPFLIYKNDKVNGFLGFHTNIVVIDYDSLYPSVIIASNLTPTATVKPYDGKPIYENEIFSKIPIILRKEGKSIKLVVYTDKKEAENDIIYKTIERLLEIKRNISKYRIDRQTVKIMLNALYGALSSNRFSPQTDVYSASVFYLSMYMQLKLIEFLESHNYQVVYTDTDSAYVKTETNPNELEKSINEYLSTINPWFKVKVETELKCMLVPPVKNSTDPSRKSYIYLQKDGKVGRKGELVKYEAPIALREPDYINNVVKIILEGKYNKLSNDSIQLNIFNYTREYLKKEPIKNLFYFKRAETMMNTEGGLKRGTRNFHYAMLISISLPFMKKSTTALTSFMGEEIYEINMKLSLREVLNKDLYVYYIPKDNNRKFLLLKTLEPLVVYDVLVREIKYSDTEVKINSLLKEKKMSRDDVLRESLDSLKYEQGLFSILKRYITTT